MSHQERKEVLKSLIHKIILSPDGSYDIEWKNHATLTLEMIGKDPEEPYFTNYF